MGLKKGQKMAFDIVYLGYVGSVGGDTLQMFQLAAGMAARGLRCLLYTSPSPRDS